MFQKKLINRIANELKVLRTEKGYTQNQLAIKMIDKEGELGDYIHLKKYKNRAPDPDILRRSISSIENGKSFQKNTSFLTERLLKGYSRVFNKSKGEVLFGNDEEIEKYCKYIFLVCGYNFYNKNNLTNLSDIGIKWPTLMVNDSKLSDINNTIMELMYFDSSFVLPHMEIILADNDVMNYLKSDYRFAVDYTRVFDETIEKAWTLIKPIIINSFKDKLANPEASMFNLNTKIYEWLSEDVIILIDEFINIHLKKDEVFKIGYEVYNIEMEKRNTINNISKFPPHNKILKQHKSLGKEYVNLYKKTYGNISGELNHLQRALFALLEDNL